MLVGIFNENLLVIFCFVWTLDWSSSDAITCLNFFFVSKMGKIVRVMNHTWIKTNRRYSVNKTIESSNQMAILRPYWSKQCVIRFLIETSQCSHEVLRILWDNFYWGFFFSLNLAYESTKFDFIFTFLETVLNIVDKILCVDLRCSVQKSFWTVHNNFLSKRKDFKKVMFGFRRIINFCFEPILHFSRSNFNVEFGSIELVHKITYILRSIKRMLHEPFKVH